MELRDDCIAAAAVAYDAAMLGKVPNSGNKLHSMRLALEAYVDTAARPPQAVSVRCQAIQYSDQMQCGRCALAWDVSDVEPPECRPTERRVITRRQSTIEPIAWITDAGQLKYALGVVPQNGMKFYAAPTAYFNVNGVKVRLDEVADNMSRVTLRLDHGIGPDTYMQFGQICK